MDSKQARSRMPTYTSYDRDLGCEGIQDLGLERKVLGAHELLIIVHREATTFRSLL